MLRLHLLFLFWILRWDEVRGWRLTTSFLLDPSQVSWKLPRGNQFLMVEDHLRWGLGKLKAQCLPPGLSVKDTSVLHSQRHCCYSPARGTHSTGSCPSHPRKRLFPGGLISVPSSLGLFSFLIICREEHTYWTLAGLWNFIVMSLHLQLQYEKKDQSSADVPDLGYQGALAVGSQKGLCS